MQRAWRRWSAVSTLEKTSTITWVRAGSGLQEKAAIRANQALEQLGILRIHRDMKTGRKAPGHETNDYKIDGVRLEACITQKLTSKTALLGIAQRFLQKRT